MVLAELFDGIDEYLQQEFDSTRQALDIAKNNRNGEEIERLAFRLANLQLMRGSTTSLSDA